jgi:thermostable 8-oxoguanine DNA glycosylase
MNLFLVTVDMFLNGIEYENMSVPERITHTTQFLSKSKKPIIDILNSNKIEFKTKDFSPNIIVSSNLSLEEMKSLLKDQTHCTVRQNDVVTNPKGIT